MYIIASSTISFQPTFRNRGFSSGLSELDQSSDLLHPDYASFIPAMNRRRMSDVLKMAITCTKDCLEQAKLRQPDAIIVGTSLGCNNFTKRFLDKIISAQGGLISPTSFIVSTHNTIAGQISLFLKNHDYNMTHTQNSLSFEQALIDGMMCIGDGSRHVLVGAADEIEKTLYNMPARLNNHNIRLACGASFFILTTQVPNPPFIDLVDVGSYGLVDTIPPVITDFLGLSDRSTDDIDLVLYSGSSPKTIEGLKTIFSVDRLFDYQKISGTYLTGSAFAMDFAGDILLQGRHPLSGEKTKRILICNNLIPENLGLILIEAKTA